MKISVVTTLYKSQSFLQEFLDLTIEALDQIKCKNFELIFVNDGSPDGSLEYLLSQRSKIPQLKLIDLSRNFGHHYAAQAGLKYASGDYIFLIDSDLETPPVLLVDFYNEITSNNSLDVVYGFQETRKGKPAEKHLGALFWFLLNKLSDTEIPYNILTTRIMTKQYVDSLLSLNDANLFLGGMMYWVGYNQKGIPIQRVLRKGASTYSFKRRLDLMIQAITSFSGKPLEWLFYFGLLISTSSFFYIVVLIIKKLIYQGSVQLGWTSIIAINVMILGVLSTFLGIIGIYIFKVFRQVQGRPNYIIKKIYD